jgi:hypothetical protein
LQDYLASIHAWNQKSNSCDDISDPPYLAVTKDIALKYMYIFMKLKEETIVPGENNRPVASH